MTTRDDGAKLAAGGEPAERVAETALPQAAILARVVQRWPALAPRAAPAPRSPLDDDAASGALDRAAECYLAQACAAGDSAAIQAFEAEFFIEVRTCHRRFRPPQLTLDELEQRIREKLFVNHAISRFSGKGDLRRWLRVLTTRLLVDHVRSSHPEVPLEDQLLANLLDRGADATLAKAQLRAEIRGALGEAFAALTDRQQILLRGEVRGTPLSAIAASYGVHVRSIQRWVREAHDVFLDAFRRALAGRLHVAPDDLSSVLAFARSQLLSGLGELAREPGSSSVRSS